MGEGRVIVTTGERGGGHTVMGERALVIVKDAGCPAYSPQEKGELSISS